MIALLEQIGRIFDGAIAHAAGQGSAEQTDTARAEILEISAAPASDDLRAWAARWAEDATPLGGMPEPRPARPEIEEERFWREIDDADRDELPHEAEDRERQERETRERAKGAA